ncbi:MAG: response regulator, partial [Gammaproteobacteria bacterium]
VESEENKGSTFLFNIESPIDDTSIQIRSPKATIKLDGINILIVDNNATNRMIIDEILSAQGAKVRMADGGEAALKLLEKRDAKSNGTQLVIVDCYLPDMDGFQLMETLVSRKMKLNTAMMISSAELNEHMARIKAIGINSYLVKPIKQLELLNLVNNALSSTKTVDKDTSLVSQDDVDNAEEIKTEKLRPLLLVEDNPDNRMLIKAYLKETSYMLFEAENGQIAVEMFQEGHYDLVLMDVQMPVMDGHKATRTIRGWEAKKHKTATPIVALTAHGTKEEIDKCLAAGCNSHLSKPIKKSTLLSALDSYFSN